MGKFEPVSLALYKIEKMLIVLIKELGNIVGDGRGLKPYQSPLVESIISTYLCSINLQFE